MIIFCSVEIKQEHYATISYHYVTTWSELEDI